MKTHIEDSYMGSSNLDLNNGGFILLPNVKLTGVWQRARNAVVRPVRLFGFRNRSARRWLGRGLRGWVSDQVAAFAFVDLVVTAGGRGDNG